MRSSIDCFSASPPSGDIHQRHQTEAELTVVVFNDVGICVCYDGFFILAPLQPKCADEVSLLDDCFYKVPIVRLIQAVAERPAQFFSQAWRQKARTASRIPDWRKRAFHLRDVRHGNCDGHLIKELLNCSLSSAVASSGVSSNCSTCSGFSELNVIGFGSPCLTPSSISVMGRQPSIWTIVEQRA